MNQDDKHDEPNSQKRAKPVIDFDTPDQPNSWVAEVKRQREKRQQSEQNAQPLPPTPPDDAA